jgi:type VI secretion system protein ImpH
METMGTDERPPVGALVTELVRKPQGFNLFQAISLLERASAHLEAVGRGSGHGESVRLSSIVSLGFQASDVSRVSASLDKDRGYVLATAVMSLAGAQGPLPVPFTEMVLQRTAARDHATADFLDIFNHRFLAFLYRSRKKHHMGLNWKSPQSSPLAACLDALSSLGLHTGLGHSLSVASREGVWLRHAGLLGGAPRSMTGLLAMLSDRLGWGVKGAQFCGAWRNLEPGDLTHLGRTATHRAPRLGRSLVLGKRVWDQSAGIVLEFSNLTLSRLRRLLPGGDDCNQVHWMTRRYLQQDLDIDMVLHVAVRDIPLTVLGSHQPLQLGLTSWLVSGTTRVGALPPVRFKLNEVAAFNAA